MKYCQGNNVIMKSFSEIIETIKSVKRFSNDYQVAESLEIKSKSMATSKMRNSIPYEELTSFCDKEGISLNWLLFGTGPPMINPSVKDKQSFVDQPRHPAAALIPVPDLNTAPGIDPTVQAMSDIKEIFDSEDQILIPAIQANLHAFKRALLRERQFEQILKENEELKNRITKLENFYSELKDQFETLKAENLTLRTENNRLKSTYEAPDGSNGDPTYLEKQTAKK
jgi:hypothetical protein